jgi:hypothetical protein
VDILTSSGEIRTSGLPLSAERRQSRSLSGTLGSGAAHLEVRTASGDVTLSR